MRYIQQLPSDVKQISLFSDTCSGQNRNQQVASALLFTVVTSNNLDVIEHKFLEFGNSYMECDSMHSTIESRMKNRSFFIMKDYKRVFSTARAGKRSTPYRVHEFKFEDFYDLGKFSSPIIKNRTKDENGEKVNWMKIKCLKFMKSEPQKNFYKRDHNDPHYTAINISAKKSRGRPRRGLINNTARSEPSKIYTSLLATTPAKKRDLTRLCDQGGYSPGGAGMVQKFTSLSS